MTPNHLDLNDHIDDIPVNDYELSNGSPQIPSDSCKSSDKNKVIHILPRVGDEYQAELPEVICKSIYISHSNTQANIRKFSSGLPIQLITIKTLKFDSSKNVGPSNSKINGEIKHSHDPTNPKGHRLVPGVNECWSDAEKGSFLLGLYVFLKNFGKLRPFVETKGMGAIMSFYYGEFYGRAEYRRWLECRKSKSRKCVFERRIFSGLRQQELLSRIFPKVSEELRNALLEVSRTFKEERMSLEDYVFSLKAMIGMHILVEAIGIGTGKQDLTGMAFESSRSNPAVHLRPDIPTGKAYSSLTHPEIVNILSGDYRLSKARSNDLFWEAIWPRLLARGWHSEQPNNKSCLVFIGPGIKKFSQRKLVKGEHYFDSVADVLGKVAKDPTLIYLETDENGDNEKTERDLALDEEEIGNNVPKQKHSYLQPKTRKRDRDVFKFLVVDTSLSDGNVRGFKTFPLEKTSLVFSDGVYDQDKAVLCLPVTAQSRGKMPVNSDIDEKLVLGSNNKVLPQKKKKFGKPHVKKRRKLSEETRNGAIQSSKGLEMENGSSSLSSGIFEFHENLSSRVVDKSSSRGIIPHESEIHPTPMSIDLNLPQVGPGFENNEQDNNGPGPRADDNGLLPNEERPVLNPRRQSTRARPLTTKALEALADGYLMVNRRRKGRDPHDDVGSSSRPLQQARATIEVSPEMKEGSSS